MAKAKVKYRTRVRRKSSWYVVLAAVLFLVIIVIALVRAFVNSKALNQGYLTTLGKELKYVFSTGLG